MRQKNFTASAHEYQKCMSLQSFKFIINPSAGHGNCKKIIRAIDKSLSHLDLQYDIKILQYKGQAFFIAREASNAFDAVVAVGGDGTVNEVFNGIVGTEAVLGIIPAGTGNGFARAIGLPLRVNKACKVLIEGDVKSIDIGKMDDRYFLGTAGIGFDALISRFAGKKLGPVRGMWIYFIAGALVFRRYKAQSIGLEIDSRKVEVRPLIIAVANTTRYGGRALIAPDARPDDGLFDICVIQQMGALKLLWHLPKLFKGKHIKLSNVTVYRGKNVTITASKPMPVHVDGEAIDSCSSMKFTLLPNILKMLVPKDCEF